MLLCVERGDRQGEMKKEGGETAAMEEGEEEKKNMTAISQSQSKQFCLALSRKLLAKMSTGH